MAGGCLYSLTTVGDTRIVRHENIDCSGPSQIISAAELNVGRSIRGLGASLTRGRDMDENDSPDLGVGAAASNSALVLRSHPRVQLTGRVTFDTGSVNAALNTFRMTASIR